MRIAAAPFAGKRNQLSQHTPEENVARLGIDVSNVPAPVANYVPAVRAGNLVFMSGQGPKTAAGDWMKGKVGDGVSVDEAYEAARVCGVNLLAALRSEIGDLNKVRRVVKLLGMVNAAPGFTDQPQVINGCSDLLVEIFGDKGKHARSAVGMGSLPMQISVEIEMIVEVEG
jgi:enamine deaminase RidA (YjgF/YER057c/UK114 family)